MIRLIGGNRFLGGVLFSALVILAGCSGEGKHSPEEVRKHLQRGERYLDSGQFKAASIEIKNALQKNPNSEEGYLLMAQLYLELGQAPQALQQLAVIEGSESAEFFFTMAEAYQQRRKFQSASDLLEEQKALLIGADQQRYLALQGTNKLALRKPEQAEVLFSELLAVNPSSVAALNGLARVALLQSNDEKAAERVAQALALAPDDVDALILSSQQAFNSGDLEGAENALTEAASALPSTDIMTPKRAQVLSGLARILTLQGRSAEALLYSRILSEANPEGAEIRSKFEESLALINAGEVAQAEKLLEEIIEKAPGFEVAGQTLALLKYNQGDLEAASKYFGENIDAEITRGSAATAFALTNLRLKQPEAVLAALDDSIDKTSNVDLLGLYGLAALSANEPEKGLPVIIRGLELAPERSRLRLSLAEYYVITEQYMLAREQLDKAYQSSPEDPYVQRALIKDLMRAGEQSRAEELVSEFEKKYAGDSDTMILIGAFRSAEGQQDKAEEWFVKAVAEKPENTRAWSGLGATLFAQEDYTAALAHYRKMIDAFPELDTGYKGLLISYEKLDQQQKGLNEIDALAQGGQPTAAAVLIEYYVARKRYVEAEEQLVQAREQHKDNVALKRVGVMLAVAQASAALGEGQTDTARSAAMAGLQAEPDNLRLLQLLVAIEIAAENYREANKVIGQIAGINESAALYLQGQLALAENQPVVALGHFQALWETAPNDRVAAKIYAIYNAKGDSESAEKFLVEWSEQLPNSRQMVATQGNAALSKQQYRSAVKYFEQSIEGLSSPPAILLNNLAWSYLQLGEDEAALDYAKRAYGIAPQSPNIVDTYGWVLYKRNQIAEAKPILEKAASLAPEDPEIQKHWETVRVL